MVNMRVGKEEGIYFLRIKREWFYGPIGCILALPHPAIYKDLQVVHAQVKAGTGHMSRRTQKTYLHSTLLFTSFCDYTQKRPVDARIPADSSNP